MFHRVNLILDTTVFFSENFDFYCCMKMKKNCCIYHNFHLLRIHHHFRSCCNHRLLLTLVKNGFLINTFCCAFDSIICSHLGFHHIPLRSSGSRIHHHHRCLHTDHSFLHKTRCHMIRRSPRYYNFLPSCFRNFLFGSLMICTNNKFNSSSESFK